MLAIKLLEESLSGNPALIMLQPAGKNIPAVLFADQGFYFIFLICRHLFQELWKNNPRIVPSPGQHGSISFASCPIV